MKPYQADFSLNRKQRSLLFYFVCASTQSFDHFKSVSHSDQKIYEHIMFTLLVWHLRLCCKKKLMIGTTRWQWELPKKPIVLMSKTTTLHVWHSFLYDCGVKLPDFTFYGKRKQAMTNLFFSFWTWILPLIQLPEGSPTFYKVSG